MITLFYAASPSLSLSKSRRVAAGRLLRAPTMESNQSKAKQSKANQSNVKKDNRRARNRTLLHAFHRRVAARSALDSLSTEKRKCQRQKYPFDAL